jgi:uncharacterized integral membrane protein
MRYLSWLFGFVLFLLTLGFAIKNSDNVVVNYYLGFQWQAPLVLVVLVAFGAGVMAGVGAMSVSCSGNGVKFSCSSANYA